MRKPKTPATFEEWFALERYLFYDESEFDKSHQEAWDAATLAERERCAKVAEDRDSPIGNAIAAAIRKGEP